MAVTIDPRPTYFGDRMIVTGSTSGGETVDLSSLLASIDGAMVNAIGSAATVTHGISGTNLEVGAACTFVAIGRRS
tara:strand:- start:683 stop:910 length:228 start_codon:yes stop_codon:yes gene_type:complete